MRRLGNDAWACDPYVSQSYRTEATRHEREKRNTAKLADGSSLEDAERPSRLVSEPADGPASLVIGCFYSFISAS